MPLNYIFHISDLHIRNGDNTNNRYDEYLSVFNNTIISINNNIKQYSLNFDDFIIIITGDIFHNRYNLSNYALLLFKDFIQSLIKIGRLYLFEGNHEYLIDDNPSLLNSLNFDIPNLTILNNTQSFIIDDIGFSYLSLNDTMNKSKLTGRIQDLPPFPPILDNVKFKIALFHGTFVSSKLFNGTNVNNDDNTYPLEWIQDFHFVLLGDIHKRQTSIYKNKTHYGYSGSLIQQNFGEDIIKHGYLLWNLNDNSSLEFDVYNDIGYINIKENDNENILIRFNGKYDTFLEDVIIANPLFPKKIEIKIFSKINFQKLNQLLNKYNILYNIISRFDEKPLLISNIDNYYHNKEQLSNLNINDNILSYFKQFLSTDNYSLFTDIIHNNNTLLFDIHKYPDELHIECNKRNKELLPIIHSCIKTDDIKPFKSSFLIKYLEWEGLLCYENKNWIDFNDLDAKTFMIKGKNGTGKSAIYDILLLSIWGKNTKKTNFKSGIINHNKNYAYSIIDILLNGSLFRIYREYSRNIDEPFKLDIKNTTLYKFIDNNKLEILFKDASCKNEVIKLFGDIDSFISSSMITQNLDNDILKLDSKDLLELIDKTFDISYIYNLYNLFKTSINKYKDFKKIIESKIQVYENIIIPSNDDYNIENDELELSILIQKNIQLQNDIDNIKVDIKDPLSLTIINTDYDELLNSIDLSNVVSYDIYLSYLDRYNELKFILKNEDLDILYKSYNPSIKLIEVNKPCELSFLNKEKDALKDYLPSFNIDEIDNDNDIDNDIILYNQISLKLNDLISNKPPKINKPVINYLELFNSFTELELFISNVSKPISKYNPDNISLNINYDTYKSVIIDKNILENDIIIAKQQLSKLDEEFNNLFIKQNQLIIINKPDDNLFNIPLNSSISILNEIQSINYKQLIIDINRIDEILNNYYKNADYIVELQDQLKIYKKELNLFTSNDDYKYNPNCHFCCNRTWVHRIKELEIIINKLEIQISSLKDILSNDEDTNDYLFLFETNENNNKTKLYYDRLIKLYDYFKYKEEFDEIYNSINLIKSNKNKYNQFIYDNETKLIHLHKQINHFISLSFNFYEYIKFSEWEKEFNILSKTSNDLNTKINYNKNIKPRILNYLKLYQDFQNWITYDYNLKIIRTHELFTIKKHIDLFDKFQLYNNYKNLQPLINTKILLSNSYKSNDIIIKNLNDKIIKYNTIHKFNQSNIINNNKLKSILNDLSNLIETIQIIIDKFQTFRIDLYKTHILNNLVLDTNNIILKICHPDTKPFQLDYLINVSKDIIHINWLIKNNHNNHIIPITQASGFQHFAISLALRISLFMNKFQVQNNQLFIDEGFINFDKFNLSIVPSFLKSLLSYFNNIIIVSHIDLIQDTIDDIVEIKFKNSNSSINYNNFKQTNIIHKKQK